MSRVEADTWFTSDSAREKQGSDYAKSQGMYVYLGNSFYWLRSPGINGSSYALVVRDIGSVDTLISARSTSRGVLPALVIELGESAEHIHTMEIISATEATCTEAGNNAYYHCTRCDKYFKDEAGTQETTVEAETIAATGHKWDEGEITTATTCTEDGVMEYTLSSDKTYYIVTGIGTASGDIIIPDTHEGLPVTYIGDHAFYDCSSLTSIEIPAGVASIENYAFYRCNNLENVTFAEGSQLTSIGDRAFQGCSSLTSIEIPAGVASIEDYAFYVCSNLESVTFAEGSRLTTIGGSAFWDCSSLTSIEIPAGVTSIGRAAFDGCSTLTSIEIPAGVTSIGGYAFLGCSNLKTVYYAGSIKDWLNIEFGGYYSNSLYYGAELYIDGELVTEVVVPESITTIGYQLTGCTSLTSITIHSGVTSIGSSAFEDCSNLESVTFAEGSQLTSIGGLAFSGCSSLTSITIPAGVTSIGSSAFRYCSSLTSIEIPAGVTSIEGYAFSGCRSLTSIEIPAGVTSIEGNAFSGCSSLTSISIPAGVTSIGGNAFFGCSSLTSISIPAGVTSIRSYAFQSCSSLTSIELPAGITSIGDYAFYGCRLTIVYNYSDLEITAGSSDHGGVAQYAEVVLTEDKLANVKDENGYVTYNDGVEVLLLGYLGSEKDIVIPEGVTRIVQYAFFKDDILSVTLPESLTAIGNSAFDGCDNLKEVYNNSALDITVGSTDLGRVAYYAVKVHNSSESESIFDDESGFAIVDGVLYGYRGSATNIIIPVTVTSIARYAFYGNTGIISVSIPAGVTSIGGSASEALRSPDVAVFCR